jgi:acyl-CoA thioester hydrolase
MEAEGNFVVVVRAECRYRRPARYDDLLTIRVTVVKVTPAKIEHEYGVLRDGELLAVGHVTLAVVDRQGNVQRVPAWIQAKGGCEE